MKNALIMAAVFIGSVLALPWVLRFCEWYARWLASV